MRFGDLSVTGKEGGSKAIRRGREKLGFRIGLRLNESFLGKN